MGNHLIGLVGASPAVITEAIWALAFQLDEPVLLDSIQIIYTEGTAHHATGLFSNNGMLAQLKADYPQQMPWSLPRLSKQGLIDIEDVTTTEEAHKAATSIFDWVRQAFSCRQDAEDHFHVVMAGGRKTMSGFMMTAFQLLAHSGDHLWHVALCQTKLPAEFFYPRPTDPPEYGQAFALHEVPCLALGRSVEKSGLHLNRPFEEILADIQHRLIVSETPPLLEIDLIEGRIKFKNVELKPDKRAKSMAFLALLAYFRQQRDDDGWLPAGSKIKWSWPQLLQFLRFQAIIDEHGKHDILEGINDHDRLREAAGMLNIPVFNPQQPSAELDAKLEEYAEESGKWASAIDVAANKAQPPLDRFLKSESRSGSQGKGRYRRIDLPPENIRLILPK